MGRIGLTDKQLCEMETLTKKEKRTVIQEKTLHDLISKYNNPELPETCKSYLHKWYANDNEEIHSKYTEKGNYVEEDLIDYMASVLGYGIAEKNRIRMEDEYFTGTCDVDLSDCIIDVKAPWNNETLQQNCFGINKDYEWQLIGYCHLYSKPKGILFYGLMDTPSDVNYGLDDVIYSDLPDAERWIAYQVNANPDLIEAIKHRVLLCRAYLEQYDISVKSKLGRINKC